MTFQGGCVFESADGNNIAAVTEVRVTQTGPTTGTWVVVMKSEPAIRNFTAGMNITYNSKATQNPNADNYLVVISEDGPAKYTCNGNWPINT